MVNGGYGAPVVTDDLLVIPTNFSDIIALSKKDGREVWRIATNCRVRSPLNVREDKIYFSSGSTIFELTSDGKLANQWHCEGVFFYGSIDVFNELIISLGTIADEYEESIIKIFAFHKKIGLVYSLPLSKSTIISADTVGISWSKGVGFVGGDHQIVSFQANDGKVLWTANIEGFAGRQVCSVDDSRVYYSTLSGVVGALNIENGAHVWSINTKDTSIVSPISIWNDQVLLLADAHLNILKSDNGQLVRKIPVGHSPYSMVSLKGEYGLLGAGEPPHNGLLFAFKFSERDIEEQYKCFFSTSNAFIESSFIDILIYVVNAGQHLASVQLDGSIFNLSDPVSGKRINATTFAFRVPLPPTMSSGDFVIPVYLYVDSGECAIEPVCISLQRRHPLPSRAYLNHIPDIVQEQPTYSGAAIGAAIKSLHGDQMEQSDVREMVDFSRHCSGYEPFQTWRILLRRILTSSASKKDQLPEFNQLTALHDE
ncbi:MAG: PQQ-binding-like beta-propeller repeat protein [Verrucomicrobia bacterium]|nr:PQQ-binding-like beta-propeller repeat protein [Verrucomicrobiota bacterium]